MKSLRMRNVSALPLMNRIQQYVSRRNFMPPEVSRSVVAHLPFSSQPITLNRVTGGSRHGLLPTTLGCFLSRPISAGHAWGPLKSDLPYGLMSLADCIIRERDKQMGEGDWKGIKSWLSDENEC